MNCHHQLQIAGERTRKPTISPTMLESIGGKEGQKIKMLKLKRVSVET